MTDNQWQQLNEIINGRLFDPTPVGFIIDSPWLPNWAGMTIMDYFSNEDAWFTANLRACNTFPDILFLPGFWSEFGMCTEPSAFGVKCIWSENEFPTTDRLISDLSQIESLIKPDPRSDGLCPFVMKRLANRQQAMAAAGHGIRFAVSRGPLNVASYLMGTSEFLIALKTNPEQCHKLLSLISSFIIDWIEVQRNRFPTIGGTLLLDDIVGFLGPEDFKTFALPYLKKIFTAADSAVNFFHNDAEGRICAPHLTHMGVNLFNFSYKHTIEEMRRLTDSSVTLLGNIPPRDVLARGSGEDVRQAVTSLLRSIPDRLGLILSCGGGMPPDVSSENIEAFISAVSA